jgi:hypothetical protein
MIQIPARIVNPILIHGFQRTALPMLSIPYCCGERKGMEQQVVLHLKLSFSSLLK